MCLMLNIGGFVCGRQIYLPKIMRLDVAIAGEYRVTVVLDYDSVIGEVCCASGITELADGD